MEHGSLAGYAAPEVKDYGSLREMTAAAHLLMGAAHVSDLSFSSPAAPGAGNGPGTVGGSSNPPGGGEVVPTTQGTISDVTDGNALDQASSREPRRKVVARVRCVFDMPAIGG